MAKKQNFSVKVKPSSKKEIVAEYLSDLQNLPQHKWIPIEGIQASNEAFCTSRQALWMQDQVESQVDGATLILELIPEEVEIEV